MGYLFSPQRLHQIVKHRAGLPHEPMMELLIADLQEAYPGHIETRQNWLFSMAAGAVGIMTVLHGSLSEYLLLFGTPVGWSSRRRPRWNSKQRSRAGRIVAVTVLDSIDQHFVQRQSDAEDPLVIVSAPLHRPCD